MASRTHPGGRWLAVCAVLVLTAAAAARVQGAPATRQKGVSPVSLKVLMYLTDANGKPFPNLTTTNDRLYPGWCDLYGFGAGVQGPGDGTSRVIPTTLRLRRAPDGTSVQFYKLLAMDTPARLTFVVVRNAPDRLESWKVQCTGVRFVSQLFFMPDDGTDLQESDEISYATIKRSYLDTDATGKAFAEIYTAYDATANTTTTGTNTPSYPGGTDADGDGIADGWEYFYGLSRTSLPDVDGDGQTNLQEYLASTDPTDPLSALRTVSVTGSVNAGMATVTVKWQSMAGKTYVVESATGPAGPWTTVATVPSAGNGTTTYTNTAAGAQFFYRVRAVP